MLGMWVGQFNAQKVERIKQKVEFSPVQKVLQRVEKRGTFLQMQDMIELLLVSGFSFEQVKNLTIGEFRDTVGGIVLEATQNEPRF